MSKYRIVLDNYGVYRVDKKYFYLWPLMWEVMDYFGSIENARRYIELLKGKGTTVYEE